MKKFLVIFAIAAAAAACGGSAGSGGGQSYAPPRQANLLAPGGQDTKGAAQPNGTTNSVPAQTVPALQGPPVIRTAQLSITVGSGKFDSKLADVRSLVESEGGFIAGTDAQASPDSNPDNTQIRTGVISFMVPAAHFDDTIDQLSKVGKVQNEHITGTDVSAQYVDLNARLVNAEAQLDAMRALLGKAQSINDIIAVQNQIGQITAQIEQLKGQIKYLNDNTSFSTVSVTLTESGAPAPSAPADSWGFVTALNEGAHNFITTINYLVTVLGAIGPFLVVLLAGYLVWRRRRPALPKHA